MTVLNRKLGRDLLGNAGLLGMVVVIIAVGVGSLLGMGSTHRILKASQAAYYREYRFADFWISAKKAPLPAVQRLARLPGLGELEGRVVFDVILDLADEVRPIHGRLISTPRRPRADSLNDFCLMRGTRFSDERAAEVILGESFAREHGLSPGDRITLLLNRRRESLVIVGTALSPEYVYMVRGQGDLTPDPRHFGILYVPEDFARDALSFQGACNQVTGRFAVESPAAREALLERMERDLDPFGVLEVLPRERQASHRFLTDEIHGLGINSTVLPAMFLSVAALVLNVLVSRLAERQRTIIGTLKALGYSNRQLLTHYLSFGLVVGVAGGVCGIGVGLLIVAGLLAVYPTFFEFPAFRYAWYPDLWLIGTVISVVFSVGGTVRGALAVLRLQPAEAMRVKPPPRGGAIVLERITLLWRRFDFRTRIALRSVFRHPGRSLTTVFATAIATSIVLVTLLLVDSVLYIVDFQFENVLRSDLDIGLRDERGQDALFETAALPGVASVEGLFGVTCDLRYGAAARRMAVTGLPPNHTLTVPRMRDLRPFEIPPDGLVLSDKLARVLGVQRGAHLELTPVRGRRRTIRVPVRDVVPGFLGMECYADRRYLSRLVGEADAISAVQTTINPPAQAALFGALKQLPNAQGLSMRSDAKAAIESTFIETIWISLLGAIVMAGVISFGSILNTTRIDVAEREREIATMRTLGYRPAAIAGIFFRQNVLVSCAGIVVAIPLGVFLVSLMIQAYDTELFRVPLVIHSLTIVKAALLALGFVLAAQWFVYRQIATLDWRAGVQVKE